MKVRFDASAGQVDQQSGPQHLSDGNHMARDCAPGIEHREKDRQAGERAADKHRGPHVDVNRAPRSGPSQGRETKRGGHSRDPLQAHQPCEHPVGAPRDRGQLLFHPAIGGMVAIGVKLPQRIGHFYHSEPTFRPLAPADAKAGGRRVA
ncbi:MAG TPA: hypothetical protein VND64_02815 [Pirellulales bacterium]|nr:hypothetical protein [Pirellulales bacterium]